jgi:hypothetical protein
MRTRAFLQRAALLLLCGAALAAGCSKKGGHRPKVVRAGGLVLYRGAPVEEAVITFTNPEANASAYAKTGPDGRFQLTTFGHEDGAVPGRHKVAVSKVEVTRKAPPGMDYSTTSAGPPPDERKHLLPERYSRPDTSELEVEVKEGEKNDFTLRLE